MTENNISFGKKKLKSVCTALAEKHSQIIPEIEQWIECQELYWESIDDLGIELEGLWSSYKRTSNFDAKYLKQHERMFVYDTALANYAVILQNLDTGNFDRSKKASDKIVELLKAEEKKGHVGLLHFSYNTSGDRYIDPYIITGANLWIFKSLYAYMLHSGDLTNFNLLNEFVSKYLFALQITNPDDKDGYGFIKAGYIHTGGNSYGYGIYDNIDQQNVLETQVPLVVMEHNADFIDLLRLMALVMDKYRLTPYFRDQIVLRHAMVMQAARRALNYSADKMHWPAAIRLTGEDKVNLSRAVDHYTWLAATFAGFDDQIAYNSLNILKNEFATEINSIEIKEMRDLKNYPFEDAKSAKGLIFFATDYDDFFVHINDPDKSKLAQMVQPEATAGGIIFLHCFARQTPDDNRRKSAFEFMESLVEGLAVIYKNYSRIYKNRIIGMPYATKNIQNYFNSMPSMAATASFYIAIQTLKSDYPYFIGIPAPAGFETALTAPVDICDLAILSG